MILCVHVYIVRVLVCVCVCVCVCDSMDTTDLCQYKEKEFSFILSKAIDWWSYPG